MQCPLISPNPLLSVLSRISLDFGLFLILEAEYYQFLCNAIYTQDFLVFFNIFFPELLQNTCSRGSTEVDPISSNSSFFFLYGSSELIYRTKFNERQLIDAVSSWVALIIFIKVIYFGLDLPIKMLVLNF